MTQCFQSSLIFILMSFDGPCQFNFSRDFPLFCPFFHSSIIFSLCNCYNFIYMYMLQIANLFSVYTTQTAKMNLMPSLVIMRSNKSILSLFILLPFLDNYRAMVHYRYNENLLYNMLNQILPKLDLPDAARMIRVGNRIYYREQIQL